LLGTDVSDDGDSRIKANLDAESVLASACRFRSFLLNTPGDSHACD